MSNPVFMSVALLYLASNLTGNLFVQGYTDDEVHFEMSQLQESLAYNGQVKSGLQLQLEQAQNLKMEYDRQVISCRLISVNGRAQ